MPPYRFEAPELKLLPAEEVARAVGERNAAEYQRLAKSVFTNAAVAEHQGPISNRLAKAEISRQLGELVSSFGLVKATEPEITYTSPVIRDYMHNIARMAAAAPTQTERIGWVTSALVYARKYNSQREIQRGCIDPMASMGRNDMIGTR